MANNFASLEFEPYIFITLDIQGLLNFRTIQKLNGVKTPTGTPWDNLLLLLLLLSYYCVLDTRSLIKIKNSDELRTSSLWEKIG